MHECVLLTDYEESFNEFKEGVLGIEIDFLIMCWYNRVYKNEIYQNIIDIELWMPSALI